MDTKQIICSFQKIGARTRINQAAGNTRNGITIDVLKDKKGEYFDLSIKSEIELLMLDLDTVDKHLLLMARDPKNPKAKFLCGHDERHWFTVAIPEKSGASTVIGAKQALKPKEIVNIEHKSGIKTKHLHKRRRKLKSGKKIFRQGEFMFVPEAEFYPKFDAIHKNEVLSRGGNPHMAKWLYRHGGTRVYVNNKYRNGLTQKQYDALLKREPAMRRMPWTVQVRDPIVYVKGAVRHPEHATLRLGDVWHRVYLNTEDKSKAAVNVAFID